MVSICLSLFWLSRKVDACSPLTRATCFARCWPSGRATPGLHPGPSGAGGTGEVPLGEVLPTGEVPKGCWILLDYVDCRLMIKKAGDIIINDVGRG